MAENAGDDKSDFESVSSSQKSFLKNCPFSEPEAIPMKSTDSDNTEVIRNQISPAVVQTPIISFSAPTSLDSINDDVFRTPPENASLSSAADSEPIVRVSETKPREGASKSKSPSSTPKMTPVSEIFRTLEFKPRGGASKSKSPSLTPKTTPILDNVRLLETKSPSDSGVLMLPLSFPPSVRLPGKRLDSDSDSSPPTEIERALVVDKQPVSDSVPNTEVTKSPDKVIKITKVDSDGAVLPFKEIIESLLRNSEKNLNEKDDEKVVGAYVEILKKCGLKFP